MISRRNLSSTSGVQVVAFTAALGGMVKELVDMDFDVCAFDEVA